MNVEERLRTERISKLLLTFSVPSIISLVITAVYNMVDQIFIGQGAVSYTHLTLPTIA